MRALTFKKIFVFISVILFISMATFPVINSNKISHFVQITNINNENDICDLLILSPSKFISSLQSLVYHKNQYGVRTKLVSLDYVYNQIWYGRDDAEKIKYFIRDAIEDSGIKYVLLVGGIKKQFSFYEDYWLPVRYVYLEDRWGSGKPYYNEKKFLCDLYFADIYDSKGNFSSWDTDGDGIYGEWFNNKSAEDILDLYPDVYVGRLPCENIFEVKIMVKKIINYENNNCSDEEWFKRMMVVAGDTYPGDDYEGETETQEALDRMPGFNPVKLWCSKGSFTGPKDVIKNLNNGCGFLYLAGHGTPSYWCTNSPYQNKSVLGLKTSQIPLLWNGNKLPVCVVSACHSSMFNVSLFHTSWNGRYSCFECFSWRLARKIGGGTIATIGNTALGYGPKDKLDPSQGGGGGDIATYFFEAYGINNTDILGEAWGKAISSYLDEFPIKWSENSYNDTTIDAKTVEQWLLIGDPSLKIGGYS